jgi:four helix bundle protein
MTVHSYRDLIAWQRAMDFVVETSKLTGRFPRTELSGLVSQLQRAAVSVPSNVAEGAGRLRTRGFIHHLGIAGGSLFEAETQTVVAHRLGHVGGADVAPILAAVDERGPLLFGLCASLERKLEADGRA